jgi:hypothetical protein
MIKISISIACMTNITCGSAAAVSRFEYQCEIVVFFSTSKIKVSVVKNVLESSPMIKINISIACMNNITSGLAAVVSRFEYECEIVDCLAPAKLR